MAGDPERSIKVSLAQVAVAVPCAFYGLTPQNSHGAWEPPVPAVVAHPVSSFMLCPLDAGTARWPQSVASGTHHAAPSL